ncbi:MAG: NPCBM/NEW2 domain-containing protein [Phycisphaerae bacterium]|jgi:pimeloyl-ACP methyl ester carboxylesterase
MKPFFAVLSMAILVGCTSTNAKVASTSKAPGPAAADKAAVPLKEQSRAVWTGADNGCCFRDWLLLGPFAYQPDPNFPNGGAGLSVNFLGKNEASAQPKDGEVVKTSAGKEIRWTAFHSPSDMVDLLKYFSPGKSMDCTVAYAFTTVHRSKAGKCILLLGSDDGIRAYVNGKSVANRPGMRGCMMDQDQVEVDLREGDNSILLKVENVQGNWGFAARVLNSALLVALNLHNIAPSCETDAEGISIRTDGVGEGIDQTPVTAELLDYAGKVIDRQVVPRGALVRFKGDKLPTGPYEVRCSMELPSGRKIIRYVLVYRGDPSLLAQEAIEAAGKAEGQTVEGMIQQIIAEKLLSRKHDQDKKDAATSRYAFDNLCSALMEYLELRASRNGEDVRVRPGGFVRLAWRDEIDGSPQFCRAYLPENYDPARKWPMVVNLHGRYTNPPYSGWWGVWERHREVATDWPAIRIEPMGRYNTGYRGIGDRDIVRAIEEAKKAFSVDEDRVTLMGESMGGGGVWHVGTRHPELFAALAPIFGGWDWHAWMADEKAGKLSPRQVFALDRDSSFALAECLNNMPILVSHGDSDPTVDVAYSRYAVRMLQRWGYNIRYHEYPGCGHGGLGYDQELMAWMLQQKRVAAPAKVRIRSGWLKDASAYWVTVLRRNDPGAFIHVEASIIAPNIIRVESENASEMRLSPSGPMIDPAKPLKVVWNSQLLPDLAWHDGQVVIGTESRPQGLIKTPQCEGPMSDVCNTPFAVVVGTIAKDPAMRQMCQARADAFARGWGDWQHAQPRMFKDTELTPADLEKYSLLLIGGPADNAVTASLAKDIPLKVGTDFVEIAGRRFAASDAMVKMVYRHPLNPQRYVGIVAGTSARGMYFSGIANSRREEDGFDYWVADGRMPNSDDGRPEEKVVIAKGFFDDRWAFDEKLADIGDPAVRARRPLMKAPSLASADANAGHLSLSDLVETRTTGSFTEMVRGLSCSGRPIMLSRKSHSDGLSTGIWHGVPSRVEFNLAGGDWRRLKGTVGVQIDQPDKNAPGAKNDSSVAFIVLGDGKELFRSKPVLCDSPAQQLDVDVAGVKTLTLEIFSDQRFPDGSNANWADIRLEK